MTQAGGPPGTNPLGIISNIVSAENSRIEFDLDNWITDFENGFLDYEKVNPLYKPGYWGQGISNRPRIREVNVEPNAQADQGYRIVEFFPDRENKDESYLFFGTPIEIRLQIAQFMNLSIMLRGMDVGAWLGYPIDEYLRMKPRSGITLQVILTTRKNPPYYQLGSEWFSKRQVTIPNVNKAKITYTALRNACNGAAGQSWGEYSARAYLTSDTAPKGIRQMVAGGSSEEVAKENLKKFLAFTSCKVTRITVNKIDYTEGNDKNDPDKENYKSFKVYPAWISILNTKLFALNAKKESFKKTLAGKQIGKKSKLFIYMNKKPDYWDSQLREVIKDNLQDS